jgi:ribosomal protein S27AE
MALDAVLKLLGGWEGFELVDAEERAVGPTQPVPEIVLRLRATPDHPKRCSRCGEVVVEIHDVTERRIRDLSVFDWDTWVVVPRARLQCPRCGPTVEAVPWLDRYQRMATRLAEKIARLATVLPIDHVAAWFRVHWATVKQIDRRALYARLGPVTTECLGAVRRLVIDEFAIQKGHRYATVKQHLATLRILGSFLVVRQVFPVNPAADVRGPKYVTTSGKTPVLTGTDARALFQAIDPTTPAGIRDRTLLGVMSILSVASPP